MNGGRNREVQKQHFSVFFQLSALAVAYAFEPAETTPRSLFELLQNFCIENKKYSFFKFI